MPSRPLILVIAMYVALDVSNPFMPGAFLFDAEESVEGAHAERSRPHVAASSGAASPRVETDDVITVPPRPPAPMGRRRFEAPRAAHIPAADPPAPTDDH